MKFTKNGIELNDEAKDLISLLESAAMAKQLLEEGIGRISAAIPVQENFTAHQYSNPYEG